MRRQTLGTIGGATGLALLVTAVAHELRLPADRRTWHGVVWGFVPYDLRRPTVARVRERLWSPDDPRLLMPHVFGVGWTPNLGRLAAQIARAPRKESP